MERKYFPGIQTADYIHPKEEAMRVEYAKPLGGFLDTFSDLTTALVKHITLGRHIAVNEHNAPDIYNIVKDVCSILDYPNVPQVYICHHASQTVDCLGTNLAQISISDYIIQQFDVDMLYFIFGNAISMFKGGHVRLLMVASMIGITIETAVVKLPLQAYLRAADLSSDRGGLLACQNISAAIKCILWNAGIPLSEFRFMKETEIITLAEAYIQSVEQKSPDWLAQLSAGWEKMTMDSTPHALQLKELLAWYRSGYCELLSRWI